MYKSKLGLALAILIFVSSAIRAEAYILYAGVGTSIEKIASDGSYSRFWSSGGPDIRSLAFDASGNLYAGTGNNIEKIAPDGSYSTFGSYIGSVEAMAFDASGNLFAGTGNYIQKIAPDGTYETWGVYSGSVSALAFDDFANLYARESDSIQILPAYSGYTRSFNYHAVTGGQGLAFDSYGNLFLGESGYLNKLTGGTIATCATFRNAVSALAFDGSGNLFVGVGHTIEKMAPDGSYSSFGSFSGSIGALAFAVPEPSTFALLGLGALGTLLAVRRKRLC